MARELSPYLIVAQSAIIHPEWNAEMHAWYLIEEEGWRYGVQAFLRGGARADDRRCRSRS